MPPDHDDMKSPQHEGIPPMDSLARATRGRPRPHRTRPRNGDARLRGAPLPDLGGVGSDGSVPGVAEAVDAVTSIPSLLAPAQKLATELPALFTFQMPTVDGATPRCPASRRRRCRRCRRFRHCRRSRRLPSLPGASRSRPRSVAPVGRRPAVPPDRGLAALGADPAVGLAAHRPHGGGGPAAADGSVGGLRVQRPAGPGRGRPLRRRLTGHRRPATGSRSAGRRRHCKKLGAADRAKSARPFGSSQSS